MQRAEGITLMQQVQSQHYYHSIYKFKGRLLKFVHYLLVPS
jgi:hypothetical protein